MRLRLLPLLTAGAILAAPAAASAAFPHVVTPGESLSSIATVDGMSVAALAAANGLAADSQLLAGSTIQIPPLMGGVTASTSSPATGTPATIGSSADVAGGDDDNDSDGTASAVAGTAVPVSMSTARSGSGSYLVQPGDTLSAIAARAGTTIAQLAAANGLNPNGLLLYGTLLRLSGGGNGVAAATSQPVGAAAEGSPTAPPYPTAERVSASQISSVAAANGVPASLADAIAWQESGFNNSLVSTADARGVMQILPGTWDWIQHTLVPGASPLATASAIDNVRGGVLLLRSLLNSTGGDPALAAAGYFQGLPSVVRHGLYPSTQRYVNDVLALARRFGGG